jgi:hypothetical protein
LLSENVGEGVGISEPTMGIAGLSLTELELPPRSELSWSGVSTADLSIAGSVTGSSSGLSEVTSLPFSVPGFSQLTATRNQIN